ncbi:MAG: SH3 domain-containing protein [Anaerolineae bacterium]|nr:SH3 domain-containing protein [Anaerolineae bacterium]
MRRMIIPLFVLLVLLVPLAAAAQSDVTVTAEEAVNLRKGPSTDYPIVATLYADDPVPAVGRNEDGSWVAVNTGLVRAWVSVAVVDVVGDVGSLTLYWYPALGEAPAAAPAAEEAEAEAEPAAAPAAPAQAPAAASGRASFTVTDFHYAEDGRVARMWVNVTNHSLTPALASGNWFPTPNPDGGRQWVTLLKAVYLTDGIPVPITGDAPLWEFVITTDDGLSFSAYAGCEYHERIVTEGFEPTAEGGFTWVQTLEGGWFSCGGDWGAGNIKPDHDLLPGQSASVPLNVWLVDPRAEGAGKREIVRIDFIPHAPDGTPFGVVGSVTPAPAF